ncbi:Threonine/homoserine efflux transporter RhtA [Desulfonispora thiosulfatigenes DSM 11270]|uniref:Threonine/homoserine efflux transporter RhtA n=1 Tax=Desulfonispora thiosulfatigenes DSM 11270 TaxID=656914 RepID=A0A1W1UXB0_DESTI|nr:EamA family transporter [Desulfonispora thiosulfatigenes]SMB85785.1 Threonine/homoserine efflux transporter RhtA [Desulfonispora thiosulfatigenes DSM 11270]
MSAESAALSSERKKGTFLVLIGATLWGVSGNVAQYLFTEHGFNAEWLTVVRLLFSGLILLGLAYTRENNNIWGIWKSKEDSIGIIIFAIFGTLSVQYTYLAAILHGNAATATVLQYLAPVLITCYLAIRLKRFPDRPVIVALILALLGTFLLVTGGSIGKLSITGLALFWGLASAVALAFYTLQPGKLLAKWGAMIVVGWGMLVGGIVFSFIYPPWKFIGQWSLSSFFAVAFIIIFGTFIAFYFYLESVKYLEASKVSLLASIEPLAAAFIAVIWFKIKFGLPEWLGTFCIIGTITILSWVKEK